MGDFSELDVVRVKTIVDRGAGARRLESKDNLRSPAIGDTGTIVDILNSPDGARAYLVESCDAAGASIWLCDCLAEELELVWAFPGDRPSCK